MHFVVFGGTGWVGRHASPALVQQAPAGDIVSVVTRRAGGAAAAALREAGCRVIEAGDAVLQSVDAVEALLREHAVDVIVVLLGAPAGFATQKVILAAAQRYGRIQRFFPIEFGMDPVVLAPEFLAKVDVLRGKVEFRAPLAASGVPYTLVLHGIYHAYGLPNKREYERFSAFGDLDVPVYTQARSDVGRVIALAAHDPRTANRAIFLDAAVITQRRAFELAAQLHPSDNIEIEKHETVADIEAGLANGDFRHAVNKAIYVAGILGIPHALPTSLLFPSFKPRIPSDSLRDRAFVFPDVDGA